MLGAEHLAWLLLLMVDERDYVLDCRHRGLRQALSAEHTAEPLYMRGKDGGGDAAGLTRLGYASSVHSTRSPRSCYRTRVLRNLILGSRAGRDFALTRGAARRPSTKYLPPCPADHTGLLYFPSSCLLSLAG